MLTLSTWLKSEQWELPSYTISPVLILGFFLLCRNEASGIQEHLVLSLKLVIFWQPFAGVNLSLVHSCNQRSKIPRHLWVVLTDSISFNYIHLRHNDNSTANCLNWLNWLGVRKRISTFLALDRYFVSSIGIPLKNSITNSLPPRSKLLRTHIISLWNVCFTRMILSYFSCFTREIQASLFKILEASQSCWDIVT